jgi:hypothetical protein
VLLAIAWMLLLALLPWWIDLPLLLALAAARLAHAEHALAWALGSRHALRWGLPGLLLSMLRMLGGGPRAWVLVLLAALAGFSLLMLLEGWLVRGHRRGPAPPSPEWSELAMAPVGPAPAIIELQPPDWHDVDDRLADPRGGELRRDGHALVLADGTRLDGVAPRCCFDPDAHWLAVPLAPRRGLLLLDRRRGRLHRLRGWQLCGWHAGLPWLQRGGDRAPLALPHVLGHDEDGTG